MLRFYVKKQTNKQKPTASLCTDVPWGRALILFYSFKDVNKLVWGLELFIIHGHRTKLPMLPPPREELGPWSVEVEIEKGEAGKGEETTTFIFKPGLTATLSKSGQEKKCHSFEVD